jgi:acyl-CoA synthetase (AMP-forming)/AMP-acid ligase II
MFMERFTVEARHRPLTVGKQHLPEDTLFLQFSGGTTGTRKCVLVTSAMLLVSRRPGGGKVVTAESRPDADRSRCGLCCDKSELDGAELRAPGNWVDFRLHGRLAIAMKSMYHLR